jgi:hypothetical protein
VGGTYGRREGDEGEEAEGIWLMDVIYEIEQRNLLQLLKWGRDGAEGERQWG